MAKFKVGDKVKVTNRRIEHDYRTSIIQGSEYIISSVNPVKFNSHTHYGVENACGWIVYEDEITLVEHAPLTKSDLKDGMVIENREGTILLLVGDVLMNSNQYMWSTTIKDDLTHKIFRDLDIVKVYTTSGNTFSTVLNESNLTLIWERKEEPSHKEMTVEEIEKELGYKIKVIADNDSSNK